jgi:hypothetical protein
MSMLNLIPFADERGRLAPRVGYLRAERAGHLKLGFGEARSARVSRPRRGHNRRSP